jgi:hypothetical protein
MHLYMLILVGFSCNIVVSGHGYEQDEVLYLKRPIITQF